jgi:predicted AlkP superfamily pyrophosphatase or phosphodiesterase
MKRFQLFFCIIVLSLSSCVNNNSNNNSGGHAQIVRPKLVVGIVIDQMRWDYLYRYYDRYSNDGFKRLMNDGFNCDNTFINYLPAYTGPGHTCVYTGSVPSIHGIAANDWIDNATGESVYCVDDPSVQLVGDASGKGSYSPRNLLVTTVTDELKLATNLRSRVYGVALKDRGSVLPAGHLANAAYWYDDKTGNFTTSTYYPNKFPEWLRKFDMRLVADSLMKQNWKLLYPASTYTQSTADANAYEGNFPGEKTSAFPHKFDSLTQSERYGILRGTPAGNTYTLMMAKACIDGEKLGRGSDADFLCVSLSSTDYIGHQFGPNSIEAEDTYLRLDKDLASFLHYLDEKVGQGNYLLFLTADHGAAHNASFLSDLDVPAGSTAADMLESLNKSLAASFHQDTLVKAFINYQLYLNEDLITAKNLDREKVKTAIRNWFYKRPEVQYVVDLESINSTALPEPIHTMVINGYYRPRSGQIQIIFNPGWYETKAYGTTHGTWQPYDTHIPLLWYGWHIPKGTVHRTIHMTDIAPTVAALLHIQMPNGCIGSVITEVAK